MSKKPGRWIVAAHFKCRVRERPEGFKDLLALEKLTKGEPCPMEGRVEEVRCSHPADNVAGRAAAKAHPEKCPLCGKEPIWSDFDIR